MNQIKTGILILVSLIMGSALFSYVSAYGDSITLDDAAGCEIQEEILEVEPDCTDPFFQDMEHKAAQAEVYENVPAPTYDSYPASDDPEFPVHVIFDEPIDVGLAAPSKELPAVEAYNQKIQQEKAAQIVAPVPVPVQAKKAQVKNPPEVIKMIPDVVPETEKFVKLKGEKRILDTTVDTHDSALTAIPQTLTIAYVFNTHLWEIVFIAFVMLLLFSLMFI